MNIETLAYQLHVGGWLTDNAVASAFQHVPRHLFLPSLMPESVYTDNAIYTRTDDMGGFLGGSDQPSQMARLLTLADLQRGQNVLEVGTGTGYNAALIQHIVGVEGKVTSLEIDNATAQAAQNHLRRAGMSSVKVVVADAVGGYAPRASYDRIISTTAIWDVPPTWLKQLRPNGKIVAPIYVDGLQVCAAFTLHEEGWLVSDTNHTAAFTSILGVSEAPPQHLYLGGGSALRLYSNHASRIDSARLHLLMLNDAENCYLSVALSFAEYWEGFIPYMMLNTPPNYEFVSYAVEGNKHIYGLTGRGFGVITQGSAMFANANNLGQTTCYSGTDAFMVADNAIQEWDTLNRPTIKSLRVRLVPSDAPAPEITIGRQYQRPNYTLYAWMDVG